MNRFDHRLVGVATGLGLAAVEHWSAPQALAGAVCAWATSGGRFSPDADQYGSWERIVRVPRWLRWLLPEIGWRHPWLAFAWLVSLAPWWVAERGRHGDPCQHRGITHWWGVPALWALALAAVERQWPGAPWWLAWSLIAGWTSHLAADAAFGRQVWGQHGHGIPLAPWWGHVGVTIPGRFLRRRGYGVPVAFRSDGWAAHVFAVGGAVPASLWLLVLIAHL